MKRGQASFEYLILMGFVVLVLGVILGIAFYYTGSIQDRIRINQLNNFANKVLTTAENVFSSGQPSKATISVYLPEGIKNIQIIQDSLYVEYTISGGINKIAYPSNVAIGGVITITPGIKKLRIMATNNNAMILQL